MTFPDIKPGPISSLVESAKPSGDADPTISLSALSALAAPAEIVPSEEGRLPTAPLHSSSLWMQETMRELGRLEGYAEACGDVINVLADFPEAVERVVDLLNEEAPAMLRAMFRRDLA